MIHTPGIGDIVHYLSYGAANGPYEQECRPAIVVKVIAHDDNDKPLNNVLALTVFTDKGSFSDNPCFHAPVSDGRGGTWHWPEPVGLEM